MEDYYRHFGAIQAFITFSLDGHRAKIMAKGGKEREICRVEQRGKGVALFWFVKDSKISLIRKNSFHFLGTCALQA